MMIEWFLFKVLRLKHSPDKPCPHMKTLLSDLSDDTARGMARWYTEKHIAGCPGCNATVQVLRGMRQRLLRFRETQPADQSPELSPERRAAVEQAWRQIDDRISAGR